MLLESRAGLIDQVRGASKLTVGEYRGAGDRAVSSDQIDHCIKVRAQGLADEGKIS